MAKTQTWTLVATQNYFEIPEIGVKWLRSHSTDPAEDAKLKASELGQMELSNARKLAMASAMLKGLKVAVMEFERIAYQKKCDPEILAMLKTCIAKAEGRS